MEVATFTCSICGDSSRDICVYCTKDACGNHLCERCRRCSDCCQCEVTLVELHEDGVAINSHFHGANGHIAALNGEHEFAGDDVDGAGEEPESSPE